MEDKTRQKEKQIIELLKKASELAGANKEEGGAFFASWHTANAEGASVLSDGNLEDFILCTAFSIDSLARSASVPRELIIVSIIKAVDVIEKQEKEPHIRTFDKTSQLS